MVYLALFLGGIVALYNLPVSMLPDVKIPKINIQMSHPEYKAREMEKYIVSKLRYPFLQSNQLKSLQCTSRDGQALFQLEFEHGTDVDYSAIEISEKIDRSLASLPDNMERPKIIKSNVSDIPILYLNVTFNKYNTDKNNAQLSKFVKTVLIKKLEHLEEVAMIDITGAGEEEITIIPDANKLITSNITYNQIERTISENNINYRNISVKDGEYQFNVKFADKLNSIEDIENIYIKSSSRLFQLKDIAQVLLKEKKRNGLFLFSKEQAISLAVIKQSTAKIDDLKKSVTEIINQTRKEYPEIKIEISNDQSLLLDVSINNLKQSLWIGALLAFMVMYFFMSNLKFPTIIGLTIPMSVIISFLLFYLMNISLNILSISGLILGIGMMVDNAIIVIDNIIQKTNEGKTIEIACVKGTSEVIRPMIGSVVTTVSIFIPLIFLSGLAGSLFLDEAITVGIGLFVSLCIAITFLPTLFYLLFKNNPKQINKINLKKGKNLSTYIDKIYSKGFTFVFRYKFYVSLFFILLVLLTTVFYSKIEKEKFPKITQNDIEINLDWNTNLTIKSHKEKTNAIIDVLDEYINQSATWIGEQDYILNNNNFAKSESKIYIRCNSSYNIKRLKSKFISYIKKNHPTVQYSFKLPENVFDKTFSTNKNAFSIRIQPNDKFNKYSQFKELRECLDKSTESRSLEKDITGEYLSIIVDFEKLKLYKVPLNSVYFKLQIALNERDIGSLKSFNDIYPIVLGSTESNLFDILDNLEIKNTDGVLYPIKRFIKIKDFTDYKTIKSDERGEYVPISYDINSTKKNEYENISDNLFLNKNLDLNYYFSGDIYDNEELFSELVIVLLISVLLLYFILAAQFESLLQPLIILLELPIDIAGTLFLLYVTNQSINIMSAIGIIVLGGIVINDSILKIDTINRLYREENYALFDAIKEGGRRRVRSILLTSLTTILALVPALFGSGMGVELQKPFAFSIIGGLALGTLVSLYFIPLLYWFINNKKTI
jgi:multidrug efflux pump subunit AcrB